MTLGESIWGVLIAGAIGGFLNALFTESDLVWPKRDEGIPDSDSWATSLLVRPQAPCLAHSPGSFRQD